MLQHYLLTQLFEIWNDTVTKSIFHIVSYKVWCSHHSHSFLQRLKHGIYCIVIFNFISVVYILQLYQFQLEPKVLKVRKEEKQRFSRAAFFVVLLKHCFHSYTINYEQRYYLYTSHSWWNFHNIQVSSLPQDSSENGIIMHEV